MRWEASYSGVEANKRVAVVRSDIERERERELERQSENEFPLSGVLSSRV